MALSATQGGAALGTLGTILSLLHLWSIWALRRTPLLAIVDGGVPLVLSVGLMTAGVTMAQGRLVSDPFVERTLAWVAGGVILLAAAAGWVFVHALLRGTIPLDTMLVLLNAITLGALIGQLVGVYDARRHHQQQQLEQLRRIVDTLRIATQELVHTDTRQALERRICTRLQESNPYESAWIGRVNPESDEIRPDEWAGLDDEYYESVVVTIREDDAYGQGLAGTAIRTREIQCSQDVMADPTLEPWHDLFAEHGVKSVAVIPLIGDETVFGLLSIYADRPRAFNESEQQALTELGETIGHAIRSLEARDQLRRRERELASQNQHLEEFASMLSHDLRNPLNVAQGFLSMELDRRDTDELQRTAEALDRMNELIDDVLTLARTGRVVSEATSVRLETVAENAWKTTETASATLTIVASLGTIGADESRTQELFENLFRNAIEHAGDDVTITVGRLPDSGGFYVADNGPGIPDSDRGTVFDTGYSTNPEGTGFGLKIVESIADAHGWTVSVTDSDEGGARFEFTDVESSEIMQQQPSDNISRHS